MARDQLRRLGFSDADIAHRVRMGRLHRLHRGVYAVGHPKVTREGRFLAAVMAIGDGAVLTSRAAGVLWALLDAERWGGGPVEVTAPRGRRSRDGIRVRAARLAAAEVTRRNGIPVTTPTRTLADLAAVLPAAALRRAVNEALVQRRTSLPQLATYADGRRGTAALRGVLAAASPTRSELEDRLLALLAAGGLPPPRTNVRVAGEEVDVLYPDAGLVIEADGAQYHDTPLARRRDAGKDARLAAHGFRVLRVDWDDVTVDGERTLARARAALRPRRPRPPAARGAPTGGGASAR